MTRLLVTGGTGQVGTGLAYVNAGRFDLVTPPRAELDLGDPASIRTYLAGKSFDAILSVGAYTAVDRAESDAGTAHAVNAIAPGLLAEAAAAAVIPILHVSTDYVFDGTLDRPYREDDPVAPLGVYGASKEAGERAVRASGARHIILRTAWVVSPWGGNFVKTMLRVGAERDQLRVVDDQLGCPTGAADIAETLLTLVERLLADPDAPSGTYHFVNHGEATWFSFAQAIFGAESAAGRRVPSVEPIPTSAYPTPAQRPANSRLATDRLEADHAIVARPWPEMLEAVLAILHVKDRI